MSVLIGRGKAPYREGMKSFTIHAEVTHDLIDHGCKTEPSNCPIALAILEEMPISTDVFVSPGYARVTTPDNTFACRVPTAATQFIMDFDYSKEVKPVTFVLEFNLYMEGESA